MDNSGEVVEYKRNEIIVSIVGPTVVVTEWIGSAYETAALHTDGRMPASVVDGPQWADAVKGHWAMRQNVRQ
jgi:hypothetical protein